MLSYKFKDILTERIKWNASLQQIDNKVETVLADNLYVLRTSHHHMAKSQLNRVSRVELRKLVTRPWCCSALARARGRYLRTKKRLCQGDWGLVTMRGKKKGGFDQVTLLHYYSSKSLQHRPSLTLSSLHVKAERVTQHSHLLHHKQEWWQDPPTTTGSFSL